jgi:hypothetical protein
MAIAGIQRGFKNALTRIPGYFLAVNASILVAWWRYLRNERIVMWNPSQR